MTIQSIHESSLAAPLLMTIKLYKNNVCEHNGRNSSTYSNDQRSVLYRTKHSVNSCVLMYTAGATNPVRNQQSHLF